MICFNFKKKEECQPQSIIDALKKVEHVVSPYYRLDAEPKDCTIIPMFDEEILHVAYPSNVLDKVLIISSYQCVESLCSWKGRVKIGDKNRHFSIRDNVIYIGKV